MLSRNQRRGGDLHAAYEMIWNADLIKEFDDRVWISVNKEDYETFLRGESVFPDVPVSVWSQI